MSSHSESEGLHITDQEKFLWKILNLISKSQELYKIYNKFDKPITKNHVLPLLIDEVSKNLSYDVSQSIEYFEDEINQNDPKDFIEKKNITFPAFKHRIGNYILEKIYAIGNYKKTVKQFIEDNRLVNMEIQIPNDDNSENSEEEDDDKRNNDKERLESLRDEKNNGLSLNSKGSAQKLSKNSRSSSKGSNKKIEVIKKNATIDQKKINNPLLMRRSSTAMEKKSIAKSNHHAKHSEINVSINSNKSLSKSSSKSDKSNHSPKNSDIFGFGLAKAAVNEILKKKKSRSRKNSKSSSSDKQSDRSNSPEKKQKIFFNPKVSLLENLTKIKLKQKPQWFTSQIQGREKKFERVFLIGNPGNDFVLSKDLTTSFYATVEALKIMTFKHHIEIFESIYENLHPSKVIVKAGKKIETVYPKISFSEFTELMNLWGEKYMIESSKVQGELIKTIKEYQNLDFLHPDFPNIKSTLSFLTSSLTKCLESYCEMNKNQTKVKAKFRKNLIDIFQFYAKVQKIPGYDDTFESIEANNSTLTIGKFFKFCADFNLLLNKSEEKRALTKETLTCIFKKTSNNARLMNEQEFIISIDKIAEVFYSPELDKALSTNHAYLSIEEKRDLLYKHLGIDNFNIYNHKKKSFGLAFNSDKETRIPLNDSSHQYRFKIDQKDLKKLKMWKQTKASRASPTMLRPIHKPYKNHSVIVKKSSKYLINPGYAEKIKMKKAIYMDKEDSKEDFYDEKPEMVSKKLQNHKENKDNKELENKVITIQALNNLKYRDIDDEFGVNELISDEKDELFDMVYRIEPKLQGIMKLHDVKLARGKKVVDKNKYAFKNQ